MNKIMNQQLLSPVWGAALGAVFAGAITWLLIAGAGEDSRGELQRRCKPDGTCIGNLVCVPEQSNFINPNFICQPPPPAQQGFSVKQKEVHQ